jgi:hypothetical protein
LWLVKRFWLHVGARMLTEYLGYSGLLVSHETFLFAGQGF